MDPTQLGELIPYLDHPNILPIHEVLVAEDFFFVVTPFVAGESLRERMYRTQGNLSPAFISGVVSHVSAALDHLHEAGIAHLDVTPANVLLGDDGHARLTNFYNALRFKATRGKLIGETTIGTPAYMSPEQIRAEGITGRSDVYSLGVVAFEMLAGRLPFWGNTLELVQKHVSSPPPAPSEFNPRLGQDFDDIVLKALAKNPSDRYARAGELALALQRQLGIEPSPEYVARPLPQTEEVTDAPSQRPPTSQGGLEGQVVGDGRYEILSLAGGAAATTTYKARDLQTDSMVLVTYAPKGGGEAATRTGASPAEETPPTGGLATRGMDFERATQKDAGDAPQPSLSEDLQEQKESAGLLRRMTSPSSKSSTPEPEYPQQGQATRPEGEPEPGADKTLVAGRQRQASRPAPPAPPRVERREKEEAAPEAEKKAATPPPSTDVSPPLPKAVDSPHPPIPSPEARAPKAGGPSVGVGGDMHGDVEVAGGHVIKTNGGSVVIFDSKEQALKYEKQARRFDTAFPNKVELKKTATLWVGVTRPDAPPPFEGVPAETVIHGPTTDIPMPVDPKTGELQEVLIDVEVRAPQYEPSKDKATLTVYPDGKPDKVRFLLEAQSEGEGVVLVQFYLDKKRLGEVELKSVVEKARAGQKFAFSLQVATLYLAFGVG